MHVHRLLLIALVLPMLLVASLAPVHAAPQPPPPTLSGEFFNETNSISVLCGNSGSFTFSAAGPATGPYPGTFTESGSVTVVNNQVTAFSATFTIQSPQGTVTGQKTLDPPVPINSFGCFQNSQNAAAVGVPTTYTATIVTPPGSAYHDQGTAFVDNVFIQGTTTQLQEHFTSTLPQPVPLAPTSKEQCKNGGYMNFIDPSTGQPFKNQGQCIAYVNAHS